MELKWEMTHFSYHIWSWLPAANSSKPLQSTLKELGYSRDQGLLSDKKIAHRTEPTILNQCPYNRLTWCIKFMRVRLSNLTVHQPVYYLLPGANQLRRCEYLYICDYLLLLSGISCSIPSSRFINILWLWLLPLLL